MATIADPRDIILAPVISEKSYSLIEDNVYTFIVHPDSNKTQIKIAIEQIFSVKVSSVNTANRQGKRKRTRDAENGVLLIKGAIPGRKGGLVVVRTAVKRGEK
ncbi:50S ribosomal protein L23 [Mycobacteroides abscessus subsp. abscessus]|nr:50S ribosomal protein L23 [Mycobacteroides abscessus subsp. abscessus]